MKLSTKEEISKLSQEELKKELINLKKEVFSFKLKKVTSGVEKPHVYKILKQNIARVKFYLSK